MKKNLKLNLLRALAQVVTVAGAVGSMGLMLHAGRKNSSVILVGLFMIWILCPFAALLVANVFSPRWPVIIRVTLYALMIVLAVGTLVAYSGVLSPPGAKRAAVFLIVPLLSLLLIAIVIPAAASISKKLGRRGENV